MDIFGCGIVDDDGEGCEGCEGMERYILHTIRTIRYGPYGTCCSPLHRVESCTRARDITIHDHGMN